MAAKLPRGIQSATWKKKDGTTTTKFRVRITRKDFKDKQPQYFDDLKEAVSYLALSKQPKGKELLYSITEEQRLKRAEEKRESGKNNFSLGYFIDCYLNDYILTKPAETELQIRNRNNKLSFYKTIRKTSIVDRFMTFSEKEEMGIQDNQPTYRFMEAFDVRQIRAIDINYYIKERLKSVKPISVQRELTMLSNVFNKITYFNETLTEVKNPVSTYDKDLLRNTIQKREFSITPDDEKKLFEVLSNYQNKELQNICRLSLFTALRRSECITLKPMMVKENYIQLTTTKSGKPRKVYLDETAKEFIKNLTPYTKDKFFKYTIAGFDRVFRALLEKNGLGHIHFHDLRRMKISRTLSQIGAENSIFVAEFLGFSSVKKLEELHIDAQAVEPTDQRGFLNNFGHASPDITRKHYFNFDLKTKEKIAELKSKKIQKIITTDEEKDLLELLIRMSES